VDRGGERPRVSACEHAYEPALVDRDEVHVWHADLDRVPEPVHADSLSADERERGRRFRFERDRRRFVAARGLLRVLLGRYLDVHPAGVRFGYGPRGKPFLASGDGLRFNVSHSGGLALLAFAWRREVGVDVERVRPVPEAEDIARRYFSPWEAADLLRLPEGERAAAFFRCWTRKEAFVKATGDGLSRPLDGFDVTVAPGEPARVVRVAGEPEVAGRFWIEDVSPGRGFAAAVAFEGNPARVVCRSGDESTRGIDGSRRAGRRNDLQGRPEPRGAVLDLAREPGEPARLA